MKMRIVIDLDKGVQEQHDVDGDVKSILRRPYIVRVIEQAMISVHGKVMMTPIQPEPTYTREEHMHDGCL